jgi:hypothetical protein
MQRAGMRLSLAVALLVVLVTPGLAQRSAVLRGRVIADSTEAPIAGVEVSIVGPDLRTLTDSAGQFRIGDVRAGAWTVLARKLGFGPLTTRLRFAAGDSVDVELLLVPSAQPLPHVIVKTDVPPPPKLREFEERRAGGFGRFLTSADIEKRPAALTSDLLRRLPGLEIIRQGRNMFVAGDRMAVPGCALCGGGGSGPPPPCFAAVVIDGALVYTGDGPPYNINLIDPSVIAGIEYYAGAASIPVKYNATRNTCGLVVIWTK